MSPAEILPFSPEQALPPRLDVLGGYTHRAQADLGGFVAELQAAGFTDASAANYYEFNSQHLPQSITDERDPNNVKEYIAKDATDALALGYLSSLAAKGHQDTPTTVIAHSYGALIYDRAVTISQELGWKALVPDPASDQPTRQAFLIAPSGTHDKESLIIVPRYLADVAATIATKKGFRKQFITQQEGLARNFITRLKEAVRLSKDKVDYQGLQAAGIEVHVLTYAGDRVFRAGKFATASALATKEDGSGHKHVASHQELRSQDGSKQPAHSDLIFNPGSTAQAVFKRIARKQQESVSSQPEPEDLEKSA